MKTTKGFTLVELVIVIIIVGILSIVAVPIYKGYTTKAYLTEAKALLGGVQTAQKVYYAEYRSYLTNDSQKTLLDIDATSNKYFTAFTIGASGSGFLAHTKGTGAAANLELTLTVPNDGTNVPYWSGKEGTADLTNL